MNNFRKYSMMFLVVAMSTIAITSCGGDDDDPVLGNSDSSVNSFSSSDNSGNSNHGNGTEEKDGHHEYVDLGLSVKWATCNIGASKPEEFGDYFAWGETEGYNSGKTTFDYSTYKWCKGTYDSMTKYCTQPRLGTVDNKKVLDPEDDAAHVYWGGAWRMPTKAEQEELCEKANCTWIWTTVNGVNGYRVTSKKNGNYIFLPHTGVLDGSSHSDAGSGYWSCYDAYYLNFLPNGIDGPECTQRYFGMPIRAVCP